MTTFTICPPTGAALRLEHFAASRGIRVNKFIGELSTALPGARDSETRFRLMANSADRQAVLAILARPNARDRQNGAIDKGWTGATSGTVAPHSGSTIGLDGSGSRT